MPEASGTVESFAAALYCFFKRYFGDCTRTSYHGDARRDVGGARLCDPAGALRPSCRLRGRQLGLCAPPHRVDDLAGRVSRIPPRADGVELGLPRLPRARLAPALRRRRRRGRDAQLNVQLLSDRVRRSVGLGNPLVRVSARADQLMLVARAAYFCTKFQDAINISLYAILDNLIHYNDLIK